MQKQQRKYMEIVFVMLLLLFYKYQYRCYDRSTFNIVLDCSIVARVQIKQNIWSSTRLFMSYGVQMTKSVILSS